MANNHHLDSVIRSYIAAKAAYDSAKESYDNLRDSLMEAMNEENITKYDGTFAKVTICQRKKYNYPPVIIIQEETLKAAKKAAERIGTAEIVDISIYPRVTVTE